jgi:hypothetical protein
MNLYFFVSDYIYFQAYKQGIISLTTGIILLISLILYRKCPIIQELTLILEATMFIIKQVEFFLPSVYNNTKLNHSLFIGFGFNTILNPLVVINFLSKWYEKTYIVLLLEFALWRIEGSFSGLSLITHFLFYILIPVFYI